MINIQHTIPSFLLNFYLKMLPIKIELLFALRFDAWLHKQNWQQKVKAPGLPLLKRNTITLTLIKHMFLGGIRPTLELDSIFLNLSKLVILESSSNRTPAQHCSF